MWKIYILLFVCWHPWSNHDFKRPIQPRMVITSWSTMLKPVFLFLSILGALGSDNNGKKIQKTLNNWNWDVKCWGEENVLQQRKFVSSAGEMCNQRQMENPPVISKISPSVVAPRNFAPSVGADSYRWRNLGLPYNYQRSPYNYPILSHGYCGRRHAFGSGIS